MDDERLERAPCPLCGEREESFLFEAKDLWYGNEGTFRVVCCSSCGMVYQNPRIRRERLSEFYPSDFYTHAEPPAVVSGQNTFKERLRVHALSAEVSGTGPFRWRLLGKVFRHRFIAHSLGVMRYAKRGRLLDLGCGNGMYLAVMRNLGWETVGLEWSAAAARRVNESYGIRVVRADIETIPFAEGSFDVVTLWDSLEHAPDPVRVMRDVRRVLKPGGLAALNVPDFGCVYRRIFRDCWFYLSAPLHYCHFAAGTLRRLLEGAGLEVLRVSHPKGNARLKESVGLLLSNRFGLREGLLPRIAPRFFGLLDRIAPGGSLHAVARKNS